MLLGEDGGREEREDDELHFMFFCEFDWFSCTFRLVILIYYLIFIALKFILSIFRLLGFI